MNPRFAGRYRLLKALGRGGMGEVFLALDLTTGTECALKRLKPRGSFDLPDLRREFDALTRVRHPAVVAALELGLDEVGAPFYTMEYVPGRTADAALARGDWAALCFVGAEVAHGLEALHPAGVVHGDLKPSNLLVIPGPAPGARPAAVRMLDFGLAALFGADNVGHHGTPGFAAPEVVRGEAASPASDLYGLGSTLYALAAGRQPFGEGRPSSVLRRQRAGPLPARLLEEAGAPPALTRLILRMLSPEIDERPRDAHEVRRELERIHPAAARPLAERMQAELVLGREREIARLAAEGPAAASRARVTVLRGEPGAGKSALLSTLAARTALAGKGVVMLSCAGDAASGILALARRLAVEAGSGTGGAAPPEAVREMLACDTDALSEKDVAALADAAVAWSRAWADRQGAPLLLLDDFDRLDPDARAFVRRLVLHPHAPPARWVWARRGSAAGAPEDERLLLEAGVADAMELSPLGEPDLARLAAARLGQPAPAALVEFLWSGCRGHPGLAIELLRAAAAAGALREDDTGLIVAADELSQIRAPASFEESLLARLDALGGAAAEAALALAVSTRPEPASRLHAIAPAANEALLARLVEAGLAARDEAGGFRLTPPALSSALLERLPESARKELHAAALAAGPLPAAERFAHLAAAGRVGEALEAAAAALAAREDYGIAVRAAEIAEGEGPAQAAAWHERAARALAARGRYAAAAPHAARALELEPAAIERPARWVLLSTATVRSGNPKDLALITARALAEPLPPAMRSRLLSNDAARLIAAADLDRARAVAREALALAQDDGDREALGVAALTLASVVGSGGPPGEFDALTALALDAFTRSGNLTGQLRARVSRGNAARRRERRDEARGIYHEASAIAREHRLRLALEELLVNSGGNQLEDGRFAEARDELTEAARLALEDGRPRGAAIAIAHLAQLEGLCGRRASALRHAHHATRLAGAYLPEQEAFAWRSLSQAERNAGRRGRALAAARRALALSARYENVADEDWCRIEMGRAAAAAGRWSDAGRVWGAALESRRPGITSGFLMLLALAGRAALRGGDLEGAAARLAEADRGLGSQASPYAAAVAETLRAELALARGRMAEGADAAGRALERFRSLGAFPERAQAALELARIVLARDGESRAPVGAWLELAAAGFERLGDHRSREQALALTVDWLRRIGTGESRPARARDLLRAVSRLLDSISDFRELTRRAMRLAVEQLDAERGVLLLADAEGSVLSPVAEHGAVDADTRRDAVGYSRRVVQRVAESGGSLLITDAPSDPEARSPSVLDLRLRSIVCVPMHLGGRVVGAVYLDDSRRPDVFGDEDRALLEGFAHLMAVAIEKSRGHEEMVRANEQLVGENLSLRKEVGARFHPQSLIGGSLAMERVLALAERAAQVNSTVLLTGENGTGKELIARILHHGGKRRLKPFVAVNCGAIPKTLLESELFGILPQVATGVRGRDGRFVQADGGTLFLDEIGEMPLEQQVALLSAISNREITPVGGGNPIPVDVRIIAATNVNLLQMLEQGTFREDLYYRLHVIPIEIPPLRERKADIPALARHFVELYAHQQERKVPRLAREFMAALVQSDWPGNVRELQNYVERVLAMTPGDTLYPNPPPRHPGSEPSVPRRQRGMRLADIVKELECSAVSDALERTRGNQSLAARELGMTEQSLRYRVRKYRLADARRNQRTRRNR